MSAIQIQTQDITVKSMGFIHMGIIHMAKAPETTRKYKIKMETMIIHL
jgi:hypothetical protein